MYILERAQGWFCNQRALDHHLQSFWRLFLRFCYLQMFVHDLIWMACYWSNFALALLDYRMRVEEVSKSSQRASSSQVQSKSPLAFDSDLLGIKVCCRFVVLRKVSYKNFSLCQAMLCSEPWARLGNRLVGLVQRNRSFPHLNNYELLTAPRIRQLTGVSDLRSVISHANPYIVLISSTPYIWV